MCRCTIRLHAQGLPAGGRLYGEMHRFIPIYAAWEGARVTEIAVSHHPRRFGKSKYGVGRIARVLLDLLIVYFIDRAFDRPIQFFGKLGLGFLVLSVAVLSWALVLKYAWDVTLIQTPLPLLAATIGLSGVLFILLGIIAEVQVRIYYEAHGRPPYKIRRIVQHPASPQRRSAPIPWRCDVWHSRVHRPRPRRAQCVSSDEPRARPSRPGRQWDLCRFSHRSRPHEARDHRSCRWRPAACRPGDRRCAGLQWRDLWLTCARRRIARRRCGAVRSLGYRSPVPADPPRRCARRRVAARRHVRLCLSRRRHRCGPPGARPLWREAALLGSRAGSARLCL